MVSDSQILEIYELADAVWDGTTQLVVGDNPVCSGIMTKKTVIRDGMASPCVNTHRPTACGNTTHASNVQSDIKPSV